MASASRWVKLRSPERANSVMSLLRNHGVSVTQISKIVRSCPGVLNYNMEKTFLPKLEFFVSLGVSRKYLAKTLAYETHLLVTSLEKRILPTCQFLRNLLSKKNFVVFFEERWPADFLGRPFEECGSNIEILRELGMPQSCISLLLAYFPRYLTQKPENFAKVVDEVKQMGFDMEKSRSVAAIKALSSGNSKSIWSRNCEAYKRWGWSEDDVLSTFKRFPPCMNKSEKKIMQVMDFLVSKMGWPQRSIVKCPTIMSFSLEKRIIPRFSVVKVLLLK
ncbi:hypothetical protein ACFX1S_040256 [Malus domestica]